MGRLLLGKGGGALLPLLQLSLLRLLITWLNECPAAAAAFCAPTEVPLTLTLAPAPSLDPNPDPSPDPSPDPNLKPKPTPNTKPQTQT